MSTKIQIRRDTASAWTTNSSVVLSAGEIGYETDTRNMKIGDGTTTWATLKYQAPYYTGANSGAANTLLALDITNSRVGIGTVTPATTLDIAGQMRLRAGPSYTEPSENAAVLNYDSTGGVLTVDARSAGGGTVIAVRTSNATVGAERLRISSAGNIGIGTNNPQSQVHIEGTAPVIRLKDTTSGTAEYASVDADTSTGSISVNANPGNVASVASNSLVALKVNGTERLRANDTGVSITGLLSTSGLITADGGLTIPSGDTLTVASGAALTVAGTGTVTVPAGSIAGAALADNGVTVAKLAQLAAGNFLGNSTGSTANVAAVNQASARTMLGLVPGAYTAAVTSNAAWINTALSGSTAINIDLDVTTMTVGVINRLPISLGRSGGSGNASVTCRAIVEAGETMLILGGFDTGSLASFTGLSTGVGVCWFWLNTAWIAAATAVADAQQTKFLPMYAYSGANTVNVLRWGQITATTPQVTAEVIAIRIS